MIDASAGRKGIIAQTREFVYLLGKATSSPRGLRQVIDGFVFKFVSEGNAPEEIKAIMAGLAAAGTDTIIDRLIEDGDIKE